MEVNCKYASTLPGNENVIDCALGLYGGRPSLGVCTKACKRREAAWQSAPVAGEFNRERLLAKLSIIQPICDACANYTGPKPNHRIGCKACTCTSGVRECPHSKWDVALAEAGILGPSKITAATPAEVIKKVMECPMPSKGLPAWSPKFYTWENVKAAYRSAMQEAIEGFRPPPRGDGRGIVIVGGGPYFPGAYALIRLLRHLGCALPIELWQLPSESGAEERAAIAGLNVRLMNPASFGDFRILRGWQLKPIAALFSAFSECICLDADSYPVRNPEFLFETPEYQKHGAIFWPDYEPEDLKARTWRTLGMDERSEWDFESGQYVVNRDRCWLELRLTHWMNQHSDYYYRLDGEGSAAATWRIWGDKSTYHLAWRRLGSDYAMPSVRPGWLVHTILQHGFDGEVLFQHRCRDKFVIGNQDKGGRKVFASTPQTKGDGVLSAEDWKHESLCLEYVTELASRVVPPARWSVQAKSF